MLRLSSWSQAATYQALRTYDIRSLLAFSQFQRYESHGERDAGDRLERALAAVIAEGRSVTYDMKPSRDDPTAVGTSQVADAVIAKLEEGA